MHCSFGDFTTQEYLWQVNSYRGLPAVDIARLIGADTTLHPGLVQGMWDELSPHIEEWRAMGIFGSAVAVPEGAPLQDRLLAMTGRNPHQN